MNKRIYFLIILISLILVHYNCEKSVSSVDSKSTDENVDFFHKWFN